MALAASHTDTRRVSSADAINFESSEIAKAFSSTLRRLGYSGPVNG
jgi:hypothetical protein